MTWLWEVLLPGFNGITWDSYFLGLIEEIFYGIYTALVLFQRFTSSGRKLPERGSKVLEAGIEFAVTLMILYWDRLPDLPNSLAK